MKQTITILADFDKPALLKDMVEQLVINKVPERRLAPDDIQTASTEAYVFGTMVLEEENDRLNIPFDGSFLFTCTRLEGTDFAMTWSSSLS